MIKKLLITSVMLCMSSVANAQTISPKQWSVDYLHSKLLFSGDQNGEAFQGGFKTFQAQIALDTDHPETSKISVLIDVLTAYAGSSDRDSMLPKKDWFDTSKFPQAQFVSTVVRKVADGKYEADGTVTLKGISKPVTLPFTLVPEGDHWHALGKVVLMRNDFSVGQGSYASEDYVKHAVTVTVDIEAK